MTDATDDDALVDAAAKAIYEADYESGYDAHDPTTAWRSDRWPAHVWDNRCRIARAALAVAVPRIVARGRERVANMHRRAQLAEGRLERVTWWVDAGMEWCRNEANRTNCWPMQVPRFYIEEAKAGLERGSSAAAIRVQEQER